MSRSELVVTAAFMKRFDQVKDDIQTGRLTFRNQPEVWTGKLRDSAALYVVLLQIQAEAKWN